MANPNRKMALMKRIDEVIPIEGADRIEAYRIGGWTVVDQKGRYAQAELVVYVEPDAFMPTSDERYSFLAERGERVMTVDGKAVKGHVLKTVRLRGQYSQGILFKPSDVLPDVPEHAYERLHGNKVALDKMMGIWEYHPDQSALAAGFVGKYDSRCAPRTDAERVQNIDQETFDLIKRTSYFTSVKVDGTSITLCNDAQHGRIRAFSHNNEFDTEQGQGKLVMETAGRQGLIEFLEEHPGTSIQAELCGPKIGNNTLRLKEYRLFVFSVWDVEECAYVPPYAPHVSAIAKSCVPYVGDSHGSGFLDQFDAPQELIEWTNRLRGSVTKDALDEGVVVHVTDDADLAPEERMALRNALGEQMQMKSVSNAFLLKKSKRG